MEVLTSRTGAWVALLLLSVSVAGAGPVRVLEGRRDVDLELLRRRGSYVRELWVEGARRERVVRALRGPATGPLGFAPEFLSATPVRAQFTGDRIEARGLRMKGLPARLGSTVRARFPGDRMEAVMTEGPVGGSFSIRVGPEELAPSGLPRVRVTETGSFHVLRAKPRSLFGIPGYLVANLTPVGWVTQALGGAAVSKGHIQFFALERALATRLNSGLPRYAE